MKKVPAFLILLLLTGCFASIQVRSGNVPPPSGNAAAVKQAGTTGFKTSSQSVHARLDGKAFVGLVIGVGIVEGLFYLGNSLKNALTPAHAKLPEARTEDCAAVIAKLKEQGVCR